ncbi:UNVERIFIED_CONTAM: hypothetical protein Slati_0911400 [Sesamum latifolium]|uniref:DUF4218 domain-containing protein n=1 Tax=Sesamum latifolium TaxID=2727402 RepID=A0AAW2XNT5_9LAMI
MTKLRMHGIKSYDCHVFMQKLIPIAFQEMVPEHVWSALTEIFSSRFFDSMEHLIVHLPYEARVGGASAIQVDPFERASGASKKRWLTGPEWHIIETYILTNCEVVTILRHHHSGDPIIDQLVSTGFKDWFKQRVHPILNSTKNELLKSHYWGPSAKVTSVPCYFVKGYNFQTEWHNTGKSTMNCGVCVKSSSYNEDNDFDGIIEEIIQLTYPLIPDLHIVLFKCRWVDPVREIKYPSLKRDKGDWYVVAKVKAQRVVDESVWTDICAYQPDEVLPVPVVGTDNQTYDLRDPNGLQVMIDNQDAGTS